MRIVKGQSNEIFKLQVFRQQTHLALHGHAGYPFPMWFNISIRYSNLPFLQAFYIYILVH